MRSITGFLTRMFFSPTSQKTFGNIFMSCIFSTTNRTNIHNKTKLLSLTFNKESGQVAIYVQILLTVSNNLTMNKVFSPMGNHSTVTSETLSESPILNIYTGLERPPCFTHSACFIREVKREKSQKGNKKLFSLNFYKYYIKILEKNQIFITIICVNDYWLFIFFKN